jgi:hypothetical protein
MTYRVTNVYVKPGRRPTRTRSGSDPVFCFTVAAPGTSQTFTFASREEAERERELQTQEAR